MFLIKGLSRCKQKPCRSLKRYKIAKNKTCIFTVRNYERVREATKKVFLVAQPLRPSPPPLELSGHLVVLTPTPS